MLAEEVCVTVPFPAIIRELLILTALVEPVLPSVILPVVRLDPSVIEAVVVLLNKVTAAVNPPLTITPALP